MWSTESGSPTEAQPTDVRNSVATPMPNTHSAVVSSRVVHNAMDQKGLQCFILDPTRFSSSFREEGIPLAVDRKLQKHIQVA